MLMTIEEKVKKLILNTMVSKKKVFLRFLEVQEVLKRSGRLVGKVST